MDVEMLSTYWLLSKFVCFFLLFSKYFYCLAGKPCKQMLIKRIYIFIQCLAFLDKIILFKIPSLIYLF